MRGFTLIEILVAIALISTMAVIALPNFRTFGENQDIKNSSLELVRSLRQAQSSATSGTRCSTKPSDNWTVKVRQNGFQIVGNCLDPAVDIPPATPSPEAKNFYTLPDTIEVLSTSCGTGAAGNADIVFKRSTVTFSCLNAAVVSGVTFTMTLKNKSTPDQSMVNVNTAGAINVQ